MAAEDWPVSEAESIDHFSQKRRKGQIKTKFENGKVQSRAKETSSKWIFTVGYKGLVQSEYEDLYEFFDSNIGGTFTWDHPITTIADVAAQYTVRFGNDELPDAKFIGWVGGEEAWDISGIILEED